MSDLPRIVPLEVLDRIRDDSFWRGVTVGFWLANVLWVSLVVAGWWFNFLKWGTP